jgi:homoserine O-acetyltransferase/O-succinyltransferase
MNGVAPAAVYLAPTPGDFVMRDFHFNSGEILDQIRIHYHTLGQPRRDAEGIVRNAVLILHGTTGQGVNFFNDLFIDGRN